jgi:hypothetical protein
MKSERGLVVICFCLSACVTPPHRPSSTHIKNHVELKATCITAPPTVNVYPAWQSASGGAKYMVKVTNNNGPACGKSTLDLIAEVPSGMLKVMEPYSLSLAPGQTGTSALSVTADDAKAGIYIVKVSAQENISKLIGSGTAKLTVSSRSPI